MSLKVYHVHDIRHQTNELNLNRSGVSHADEFEQLRRCLRFPTGQIHLLTWQELLARAEATFDPDVRPLLTHARRLSNLRTPAG